MRSRRADFLTSDGDKPDYRRDTEFEDSPCSREELLRMREEGRRLGFATVENLTEANLACTVTTRAGPHSVMQAINRQRAHYACHVGQIVYLARHFAGDRWQSLSIPRGKSAEFNTRFLLPDPPR